MWMPSVVWMMPEEDDNQELHGDNDHLWWHENLPPHVVTMFLDPPCADLALRLLPHPARRLRRRLEQAGEREGPAREDDVPRREAESRKRGFCRLQEGASHIGADEDHTLVRVAKNHRDSGRKL